MRILILIAVTILAVGCTKDDRPICPSCGERATMIMHPRMPEIAEMGWAQTHYKCENQHNFTKDGELVDVFGNPLKKKKPFTKADPKFRGDKLVPENAVKKALIPTEDIGTDWTELNYDDFVWLDVSKVDEFGNEVGGGVGFARSGTRVDPFDPFIALDLEEQMYRTSATVYLRIPFTVEDKSQFKSLVLGVRTDDGFVAWLNGEKVQVFKGPEEPQWDSEATSSNQDSIAITMVDHCLNDHMNKLVNGPNILAIQALNKGKSGSDFLFSCQLEGITSETTLKYKITGDVVTITGCDKNASCALTIPDTIQGKTVTSIGASAFSSCNKLTSITIPDGITNIGANTFRGCTGLTSITIPDGVTSIEEGVFDGCKSLTSITIPDSVTSIGASAFSSCNKLTSITIPDGITNIGANTFRGCTGLTSITIPDSVTSIGERAFKDCTSLTSITIPDSVTSIGDLAFYTCRGLTSITIPDGVTSIGDGVFAYCRGLTTIMIPDSVTSIDSRAFNSCNSLTTIEVGVGNVNYTVVNGVLFNTEKTVLHTYPASKTGTTYTISDNVTSIGDYAFTSCSSLTSVTIPDSVTSIGGGAFYICSSLTMITIPDSVTSIGDGAFQSCSSLTSLTFLGDAPKKGEAVFIKSNPTIYRKPDAKGWGNYFAGRPVKLISEKP